MGQCGAAVTMPRATARPSFLHYILPLLGLALDALDGLALLSLGCRNLSLIQLTNYLLPFYKWRALWIEELFLGQLVEH